MAGTKYAKVAADAFSKLQLNAGVILKTFDPSTGTVTDSNIVGQTGGGTTFTAVPQYIDFGDGIDNVPANTMQLKRIDYYDVKMSGTMKTLDTAAAKLFIGAATVATASGKVAPKADLTSSDFEDEIWWVGDYSDVNSGANAGFIAIKMMNVLSTGGFSLKSNNKDKGDFDFELSGHYDMENLDTVPFEVYVKSASA